MSAFPSAGVSTFNLSVGPGPSGLPAQGPLGLQAWMTQEAWRLHNTPPAPPPQPLATATMSALLAAQEAGR